MKKMLASIAIVLMLVASIPAEARFGGGGRSFSSSRPSSSFSSARSPSSYSAPVARPTGISSGGNVGMQRPTVTNAIRNPSTTTAPSGYGSSYQPSYGSQRTTIVHNYGSAPSATAGGGQFGMGSLAMAAMGGYMLNGIMHDHSGAVYNGTGYTNGVPTPGGQYYQNREEVQPQMQQQQYVPVQPQIQRHEEPTNWFNTFLNWLMCVSLVVVIVAFIRRVYI